MYVLYPERILLYEGIDKRDIMIINPIIVTLPGF